MGNLLRQVMIGQNKDAFFSNLIFDPDIIPELILLGTLEQKRVPRDDGKLFEISIIHYEGRQYIMKQEDVGRWFDER
jgi:hypothetical protein